MGKNTFQNAIKPAWDKLNLGDRRRPDEVFPRFKKEDFDALKSKYQQEHGYVIKIPEISDIIHLKPNLLKSPEEIRAEKIKGLNQILASPAPEWVRKYSTAMTFLDDVQDATSVIYPAIAMLSRVLPKVMNRILPVLGWLMLAGDLLNLAIGIGRLPMAGMGGKRLNCKFLNQNPFGKMARLQRAGLLRNYKPGIADLLQVAQTTDNIIGVGLSLGPLVGLIQDAITGAYRYATGEKVRIMHEVPDMFEHEHGARNAIKASAMINTRGQEFSEEIHFWSFIMSSLGGRIYYPYAYEAEITTAVEDPMSIMIPAPYPKDPMTIEVIKNMGLDPLDGYGWPINGEPEISLGDLADYLSENTQASISGYWNRHGNDWYGLTAAVFMDQTLPLALKAFDPDSEIELDDSPMAKVVYTMLKAPLLPIRTMDQIERDNFFEWVNMINHFTNRPPGLMKIKEKFDSMKIPYRQTYPATREPEADLLFDKDLDLSPYNLG